MNNLGKVVQAARAAGYVVLVTADHGNLEEMIHCGRDAARRPYHQPGAVHSDRSAPAFCLSRLQDGSLADIAPTILSALGIEQPPAMTGNNLAPGHDWGGRRRVLLVILDGWGIGRQDDTNPIFLAANPGVGRLAGADYPLHSLQAAGEAVGLKPGKAGNSEAGHMNIGAGRVVLQDDVRLDQAMQDGSFYSNEILCRAIEGCPAPRDANLHLIGLLTEKSSHGSIDYPLASCAWRRKPV